MKAASVECIATDMGSHARRRSPQVSVCCRRRCFPSAPVGGVFQPRAQGVYHGESVYFARRIAAPALTASRIGLLACLLSPACKEAEPLTELVIAVDSDWSELDRVRIEIEDFGGDDVIEADVSDFPLPMTLSLIHDGGPLGPFGIKVSGFAKSDQKPAIVEPRRPLEFVAGKTRALRVVLRGACVGFCSDDQACRVDRDGEPECIDPDELVDLTDWEGETNLPDLPVWKPSESLDGGPGMDAGHDAGSDAGRPIDGGDGDGGPQDAGADGGTDASDGGGDGSVDADTGNACQPACGFTTADPNATTSCVNATCVLTCKEGYADCDGELSNGCEVTLDRHCGPCQGEGGAARRKPLVLAGSRIAGTLSGFPLPIDVTDSDLTEASDTGTDLCVTAADGKTALPFEIETFDRAAGHLLAWVRMPALAAGANAKIYLYYAGPAPPTRAFEAPFQGDYQGVWHMTDGRDATPAGLHAQASPPANAPLPVPGQIGGSQRFDGADDYLEIDRNELDGIFTGPATIEAWIHPNSWGEGSSTSTDSGYGRIADKSGDTDHSDGWAFYVRTDGNCQNTLSFGQAVSGGTFGQGLSVWCGDDDALELDAWQHVALVYDPQAASRLSLYVDGQPIGVRQIISPSSNTVADDSAAAMRIGQTASSDRRAFDGEIDELRISRNLRSGAWLQSTYATQRDAASNWSVGSAEDPP